MFVEQLKTQFGTSLRGPLLITPQLFEDDRGFFYESWNQRSFCSELIAAGYSEADAEAIQFRQDNHSRSCRGVLRGLHFQLPPVPQGKLVRCTRGSVFDVAVDLRRSSTTFSQWAGVILTAENCQQFWIPVGFAHGFLTLSEVAEVQYKASGFWNRDCERSLRWNDPTLAIQWPLVEAAITTPLLAPKDSCAPFLEDLARSDEVFA